MSNSNNYIANQWPVRTLKTCAWQGKDSRPHLEGVLFDGELAVVTDGSRLFATRNAPMPTQGYCKGAPYFDHLIGQLDTDSKFPEYKQVIPQIADISRTIVFEVPKWADKLKRPKIVKDVACGVHVMNDGSVTLTAPRDSAMAELAVAVDLWLLAPLAGETVYLHVTKTNGPAIVTPENRRTYDQPWYLVVMPFLCKPSGDRLVWVNPCEEKAGEP